MAAFLKSNAMSINDYVVSFLNSHFDDNIRSLAKIHDVYKAVAEKQTMIEEKLSKVSRDVPSEIKKAIKSEELIQEQLQNIGEKGDILYHDVLDHIHNLKPMVEDISHLTQQVQELEKLTKYMACVARVEELSSEMQSCLLTESLQPALESFQALTEMYENLQDSRCCHLLSYLTDTILFWNQILRDRVADEFEEVLKAMRWPMVATTLKAPAATNAGELKVRLSKLFRKLLHLQLPDSISLETHFTHPLLQHIPGLRPLLLPLHLMVKPLKKRFRYHFYGKRQTNSLEKPEWYLTQALSWIRDHWDFLDRNIQPLLDEADRKEVCAKTEFMRGIVMLVMEKLAHDLPLLLYDDVVFSHTIDEVLLFERELRSTHGYPPTLPGCLDLLATPEALSKWLAVEKKFAVEKVEIMLQSPTAWESQYKDIADMDEVKVPECAESFMTLLYTITDRYKPLPDPVAKVRFLGLQLELLEDFRIRLVQVMKEVVHAPTGPIYTAVLNAIHYIAQVLREWSELVFFLQIQYYRTNHPRLSRESVKTPTSPRSNSFSNPGSPSQPLNTSTAPASQKDEMQNSEFECLPALETTVFDDIIDLFEGIVTDMVKNIVTYVFIDVQARSQPYKRDKWLALPPPKELALSLGLSASACEMLLVLKDHMCSVEEHLGRALFTKFWQQLAARLSNFIFNEVILANHFSEGGAAQLHFDMVRNLFPLFGEYTQKPESYFKEVKEACILLTLRSGSAILLREILYSALHEPSSDPNVKQLDPIATLHDIGIFVLSPEQSETVLSLRANLSVM